MTWYEKNTSQILENTTTLFVNHPYYVILHLYKISFVAEVTDLSYIFLGAMLTKLLFLEHDPYLFRWLVAFWCQTVTELREV